MFDLLFIVSIIGTTVQAVKEACTPTIPADNWVNKELYRQDIMNGVPVEQRMENLKNGKYQYNMNQYEYSSYPKNSKEEVRRKTKFEERYGL